MSNYPHATDPCVQRLTLIEQEHLWLHARLHILVWLCAGTLVLAAGIALHLYMQGPALPMCP